MGRGEHPWKNHHKKINAESVKLKARLALGVQRLTFSVKNCILGVVIGILLDFLSDCKNRKIKKLKHTGN
jgi:hypothetical protein